jgi:hypothetical protein
VSYHWKDATAHVVEAPAWLTELALAASSHGPRRTIIDLNANGAPQKSGGPSSARDHVWARAALALIEGAEACGLIIEYGKPSVSKTIDSGLRAGMKYPRQRPR